MLYSESNEDYWTLTNCTEGYAKFTHIDLEELHFESYVIYNGDAVDYFDRYIMDEFNSTVEDYLGVIENGSY